MRLLTIIVTLFLVSCSTGIPTENEVQTLIFAIPDHQIKEGSEKCFTAGYYALLKEAWAIPSDAIGEIGSDEWLFYFISGNDMPDNPPSPEIFSVNPIGDGVEVIFNYLEMEHRMTLANENGKWVIADYDGTLGKLKEYIDRQREYFRSDAWKQYLENTRKEYSAEAADYAEKEVAEYFRKYR